MQDSEQLKNLLLTQRMDFRYTGDDLRFSGKTALDIAVMTYVDAINLLLKGPSKDEKIMKRALYLAIKHNSPEAIKLLIADGAQVRSGLYKAVQLRQDETIQALIDNGYGVDLLGAAIGCCCEGVIKKISDVVDVRSTNKNGQTALLLAAEHERFDLIKLLLGRSSDVEAVDNKGRTALNIAAYA